MRTFASKTLLAVLVLCLAAAPAFAGKKKTFKDSFTAQAVPFPNFSSLTMTPQPGCFAGEEGVHKVTHDFTAPGTGSFTASMSGFTGDWDLMVLDHKGTELGRSMNEQVGQGGVGEPEELIKIKLKKKAHVYVVACNWLGAPEATVELLHVYK